MGFFKKLFGTAAVAGAAVGGALYVKKRKEEKDFNTDYEDFDDEKIFDISKENDEDGKSKVTIVFNSKKAKNVADKAADKVISATHKVKDAVTDTLGEDRVSAVKDKVDVAKDKIDEAASFAKDKAKDAKEKVVETVGEENIQAAKDKVKDVASAAKDKVTEAVDKYIKPSDNSDDVSEDDFVDEDAAPADTADTNASETEDDVNIDDILEDELDEV